jgi:hypothetical protein
MRPAKRGAMKQKRIWLVLLTAVLVFLVGTAIQHFAPRPVHPHPHESRWWLAYYGCWLLFAGLATRAAVRAGADLFAGRSGHESYGAYWPPLRLDASSYTSLALFHPQLRSLIHAALFICSQTFHSYMLGSTVGIRVDLYRPCRRRLVMCP